MTPIQAHFAQLPLTKKAQSFYDQQIVIRANHKLAVALEQELRDAGRTSDADWVKLTHEQSADTDICECSKSLKVVQSDWN